MTRKDFAAISAAAYARFTDDDNNIFSTDELNDRLKDKANFNLNSQTIVIDSDAERFSRDFEVLHSADFIPGDKDGFSATLFKAKSPSAAGRLVLGVRGTELLNFMQDVLRADVGDIGLKGIALKQGVQLFNYYQRLITPTDEKAIQVQLVEGARGEKPAGTLSSFVSGIYFEPNAGQPIQPVNEYTHLVLVAGEDSASGLGLIGTGVALDVTGHSLGGHLAMILSRIDPDRVGEVATFNAPGFGPALGSRPDRTDWFFEALGLAQEAGGKLRTVASEFPAHKMSAYRSEGDLVSLSGDIAVEPISHFSEGHGPILPEVYYSHLLQGDVRPALAVIGVLELIFPNAAIGTFNALLEDAGTVDELQGVTDALSSLLGVAPVGTTGPEQLHDQLEAIRQHVSTGGSTPVLKPAFRGLRLQALGETDLLNLSSADKSSLALRYALINGLSFAVSGPDDAYSDAPGHLIH